MATCTSRPAFLCFHWLCPNVRDMTWPGGICSPSLEAAHTQTPIIGITHSCPVVFLGYPRPVSRGVSPVEECMFCLWSVTCPSTVGPNWMWALSEEIRAKCVGVWMCVLAGWLVGRHQYRWGLQMWWASWPGLLLSSWFSVKKRPASAVQSSPSSPPATASVPFVSLSLSHTLSQKHPGSGERRANLELKHLS